MHYFDTDLINTYNTARKYVSSDFKITRIKTMNADNVPFELLGNEFIYKFEYTPLGKYSERVPLVPKYLEEVTEFDIHTAFLYCVDWASFPAGDFIELDVPREAKWDPSWVYNVVVHAELVKEYLEKQGVKVEGPVHDIDFLFFYLDQVSQEMDVEMCEDRPW